MRAGLPIAVLLCWCRPFRKSRAVSNRFELCRDEAKCALQTCGGAYRKRWPGPRHLLHLPQRRGVDPSREPFLARTQASGCQGIQARNHQGTAACGHPRQGAGLAEKRGYREAADAAADFGETGSVEYTQDYRRSCQRASRRRARSILLPL